MANFISGIIILFERPIRVGDIVTVGDKEGTVTRIRIRATTIRDWDGKELLVPNKEFITGRLLNWTLSDTQTRVVINVGIAYGSNVEQALQILTTWSARTRDTLKEPRASDRLRELRRQRARAVGALFPRLSRAADDGHDRAAHRDQ